MLTVPAPNHSVSCDETIGRWESESFLGRRKEMKNSSHFSTQGSIFLYPEWVADWPDIGRLWSENLGGSTCLFRSEKVWKCLSIACFFALRFSTSACSFKKIILPSKKVWSKFCLTQFKLVLSYARRRHDSSFWEWFPLVIWKQHHVVSSS